MVEVFEKTMYFPLHLEKEENEAKFWGRDKLVLSPTYRIDDLLEFVTVYSRLRDPLAQPLKKIAFRRMPASMLSFLVKIPDLKCFNFT